MKAIMKVVNLELRKPYDKHLVYIQKFLSERQLQETSERNETIEMPMYRLEEDSPNIDDMLYDNKIVSLLKKGVILHINAEIRNETEILIYENDFDSEHHNPFGGMEEIMRKKTDLDVSINSIVYTFVASLEGCKKYIDEYIQIWKDERFFTEGHSFYTPEKQVYEIMGDIIHEVHSGASKQSIVINFFFEKHADKMSIATYFYLQKRGVVEILSIEEKKYGYAIRVRLLTSVAEYADVMSRDKRVQDFYNLDGMMENGKNIVGDNSSQTSKECLVLNFKSNIFIFYGKAIPFQKGTAQYSLLQILSDRDWHEGSSILGETNVTNIQQTIKDIKKKLSQKGVSTIDIKRIFFRFESKGEEYVKLVG